MIVIRAMSVDDLDWVLRIETRTPEAPQWDHAVFKGFLISPDTKELRRAAWVAVDEQDLIGFAVARLVLDVCELESIVVAENARRKGTGKALLNTVFAWAQAHGAGRMELEVRAGNENAIRFYEQAGLLTEGMRRGYYHNPEEGAVLMGKSLESEVRAVENFPRKTD